jgi:hypothetical protein
MCKFCNKYFLLKADKDKELENQKETDIKTRTFEYRADCNVIIIAHYKGVDCPYVEGKNKIVNCEILFCPLCGRDLRKESADDV